MTRWPVPVRAALTLATACAAGWGCAAMGLPLGWLAGPMLVMMVAAAMGLPAVQPSHAVPWVKSSVGTFLGAAITWPVLQSLVDAEDAARLLLARELTIEEKREFVDLRIEGWLRTLPEALSRELRPQWSQLREFGKDEFELDAIQRMIALEQLRGGRGA